LEAQILSYSLGDEEAAKKSESEIQEEVEQSLQKLVDEAVSAFSVSPMEDPDYKPEDEEMDEDQDAELAVVGQGIDIEVEHRPKTWTEQLAEALDHVRELGKVDGEAFAEMVCSTFQELNGSDPSLEQMTNLYSRIRTDFGNEAEEELEDGTESEIESESESEVASLEEVDVGDEWADALERVGKMGRADGRSLAHSICDLFADVNGSEPTLEELHAVWQSIQDGLAEEAQNVDESSSIDVDSESDWESAADEEGAFDPNNAADQVLAKRDAAEDRKHEVEHFEQMVLNTPMVTGKRGGGVSWNMYFDESELNEEAENSNLVKTVEGFKLRNGREPTRLEVHKMKQFLSVPNELVDGEEEMAGTNTVLQSQMVSSKRGGSASWTVYFDEARSSLKKAKRAFLKMHRRSPTTSELDQIRSFLAVPSELDMDGLDEPDLEQKEKRTPSKVLVSPVQDKKTAKRFSVYLEDSKLSQKETELIAVKWFNRFNQREPSDEELAQIRSFIAKDADLTEQEFLVPVKSLNFDAADDDEKDTEPVAELKLTTKAITEKKTATGYTLNFDDDEKCQDGDEEEAIKWFKRFNQRQPTEDEQQQIKQFMKADDLKPEMIDIE